MNALARCLAKVWLIQNEVGKVFAAVLEDAGVFRRTEEGRAAFLRFIGSLQTEDR